MESTLFLFTSDKSSNIWSCLVLNMEFKDITKKVPHTANVRMTNFLHLYDWPIMQCWSTWETGRSILALALFCGNYSTLIKTWQLQDQGWLANGHLLNAEKS